MRACKAWRRRKPWKAQHSILASERCDSGEENRGVCPCTHACTEVEGQREWTCFGAEWMWSICGDGGKNLKRGRKMWGRRCWVTEPRQGEPFKTGVVSTSGAGGTSAAAGITGYPYAKEGSCTSVSYHTQKFTQKGIWDIKVKSESYKTLRRMHRSKPL